MAKILFYDIETSPNIAYIWGKYEQNALGKFIQERKMISVAWKWSGEKKVYCSALPHFASYKKDPDNNDSLVRKFHSVICEADIAVAHNLAQFDDKMINTDFFKLGLNPPTPHQCIDTLKAARASFKFNSNKLNDLCESLKIGSKVKHAGFELWAGCLRGDKASWRKMIQYNKHDVILLEQFYYKIRPWITNHPNLSNMESNWACPACQSTRCIKNGWRYNEASVRQRYQCIDCGKPYLGPQQGRKKTI